jgi:hypothetical protein
MLIQQPPTFAIGVIKMAFLKIAADGPKEALIVPGSKYIRMGTLYDSFGRGLDPCPVTRVLLHEANWVFMYDNDDLRQRRRELIRSVLQRCDILVATEWKEDLAGLERRLRPIVGSRRRS